MYLQTRLNSQWSYFTMAYDRKDNYCRIWKCHVLIATHISSSMLSVMHLMPDIPNNQLQGKTHLAFSNYRSWDRQERARTRSYKPRRQCWSFAASSVWMRISPAVISVIAVNEKNLFQNYWPFWSLFKAPRLISRHLVVVYYKIWLCITLYKVKP